MDDLQALELLLQSSRKSGAALLPLLPILKPWSVVDSLWLARLLDSDPNPLGLEDMSRSERLLTVFTRLQPKEADRTWKGRVSNLETHRKALKDRGRGLEKRKSAKALADESLAKAIRKKEELERNLRMK